MTASISGKSDRVVVVGAGLSGLSAALHLLGTGHEVTVIDKAESVGGRMGSAPAPGYRIDTGASVLTMPNLIEEALAAVGETFSSTTPKIELLPLNPSYHTRYADGTSIDVHADADTMATEVDAVCGPAEAARYRTLRRWLASVFDAEFGRFIDANFDSPLDLVRTRAARSDTLRLVRLGGFGRLGRRIDNLIDDARLRRVFTFQALYAGVAPRKALAVYGAIAHMDTSLGVSFPVGGMRVVAEAMTDAVRTAGGTVVLGAAVEDIEFAGRRARAVRTADGRRFPCDALILTPDLLVSDALLSAIGLPTPKHVRVSPSAVVAHGRVPVAVTETWAHRAHHTIDFGAEWDRTFEELTARGGKGRLMSDPSLLITRPSVTDPALRITSNGVETEPISILAPCPNLDSAPLDWDSLGDPYARELLAVLESRGYTGLADSFVLDRLDTPATWLEQGMLAGSPFSAAHLFRQTGPFRRRNVVKGADNIVLAGCGTTPGVGVPTVLVSGKLAAQRVDPRVN